ncbi:MAG: tetratricopeptide repeat protein [Bdellovibrionota bacterium]
MKSTLISKFKMSIAAVFLFSFSNALAKDTDHQQVSVQVKQEKREKSGINTKAGDGAGRPRLSTAEIYAVEIEKKLVEGIDKTIAYLNKTAKSLPKKSGARLEMLTRVHNLHMEQAVYVASDEYRRYEQLWGAWNKGGRKGREPKLDQARSRLHWQKVSSTGRNILREFPKNKGADVINFNQALSLSFLGQEKNAARAFTQLIQKFPNSPVAGDAYFSLGDYYFDRNDFRNAVNNFKLALKYRKSKRYGWALFKLGWCYYNLGKYRESLKFWKNTVSHSKRLGDKTGLKLKEEAMRDLVYAYAELKEVESAISYFRANGGQRYIGQFLTLLAETFADQGAFKRSIKVWERLQSIIPRDPSAAIAQNEIISLYFELNDLNTVWRELNAYYTNYGRKSGWAVANEKKLVLETQVEIQKAMLYYAKVVHKNAQKRNNNSLYEHAVKGYRLYLSKYPKSREVAEVKFNLADIKFHQKEFRQSGVFISKLQ